MRRRLLAGMLLVVWSVSSHGQTTAVATTTIDPGVFTFEDEPAGHKLPAGWAGGPAENIWVDGDLAHSGRQSVRLERDAGSANTFTTLTNGLKLDFRGKTIALKGYLRTEKVSDFAGLWIREDEDRTTVAFDNMQSRRLKSTTGWTEYTVELPLRRTAQQLVFGVLLSGTGKLWADDLQLLIDGKPLAAAPRQETLVTPLGRDHEFDAGSGITLRALSPVQVDNLVTLGKVWGFLKYYHPAITAGSKHWDYELFRIAPAVLAAPDRVTAQHAMSAWVEILGPLKPCAACVALKQDQIAMRPNEAWIRDAGLLGVDLSRQLVSIEQNRTGTEQFYVSLAPHVGNPVFLHEPAYANLTLPDSGYQLLAVYRFWNIVEYWSPDRDIVGEDWDSVLRDFIPRVALARDKDSYEREMMALIAEMHDGHANLWSSLNVRPPVGDCMLPINLRFLPLKGAERVVVTGFASPEGEASGLKPGDVIARMDGVSVSNLIAKWMPYYAGSNDAARLRDIARSMTQGECTDLKLDVEREGKPLQLTAGRLPTKSMQSMSYTHDLPGDAFRLLSPDVAYLKLSSFKIADVDRYLEQAANTKGLIIDIRNYPSEFAVFALGSRLVEKPTPFAVFTKGDLATPGAFHWSEPVMLVPAVPAYSGKVVILVDETSMSQAEYTAMALRVSPNAFVIGSTTSGADGNVSPFSLPGGLQTNISGLGVFYPDKRPTQQVGIVPDQVVYPTLWGPARGDR